MIFFETIDKLYEMDIEININIHWRNCYYYKINNNKVARNFSDF